MRKVGGVIGWPVAHSLSPKLHGYWLKKYGIDGEYKAIPVKPEELKHFIETMPESMVGCNVTIPHKEAAAHLLEDIDETAKAVGAVNTIVVKNGTCSGANTDVYGFAENIKNTLPARREKAIVLGAGGAAKSVGKALIDFGFSEIIILNRTFEKAVELAVELEGNVVAGKWENRSRLLDSADLLVNATSLGMVGKDALDIDLSLLPKSALVTDIVYTPLMTPLLQQAKVRGNPVVDGLGMLLYQAVPGFEAWFGVRPEVTDELRKYLLQ